jgi:hypothetical protein
MKDVKVVDETQRKTEAELAAVKAEQEKQKEKNAYNDAVNAEVRKCFSSSEEASIIRHAMQKLVEKGVLNDPEFVNYNAIVEQCKLNAKKKGV